MNQEQEIWTIDHYIRDMCDHILNFAFNNGHIPQILFQKGPVDSNTQPKFINNSIIITCPPNMDDNTLHSMLMKRLTTLGSELAIGDRDTCTVKLIQFESPHRYKADELEKKLNRQNSKKNNGIFYKVIKFGGDYCVMECNVKDLKLKQALQSQYRHQQVNKNNREDNTSIDKKKSRLIASIQEFLISGEIGETPTIYKDEEEDKELLTLYYAHQILSKIQSPNKGYIRQTYLKTISDNYQDTDPKEAIKITSQCLLRAACNKTNVNIGDEDSLSQNLKNLVSYLKGNLVGIPAYLTINLESETTEMDMENCLKKLEDNNTITYITPNSILSQPIFTAPINQPQIIMGNQNNNPQSQNNNNNPNNFNMNNVNEISNNSNQNINNQNNNFGNENIEMYDDTLDITEYSNLVAKEYQFIDRKTYEEYLWYKYNNGETNLKQKIYFGKQVLDIIKKSNPNNTYISFRTNNGKTVCLNPTDIQKICDNIQDNPIQILSISTQTPLELDLQGYLHYTTGGANIDTYYNPFEISPKPIQNIIDINLNKSSGNSPGF